ncbi:hydroxymethylbilane synthase [Psychroflexus sp. CAK57W]|uniref:hydroxymethylbilane synthase n=1 Tax=Psychroflexus curvus TaxID=2873595 RepID=UPI001CCA66A1|nr:hydroxymethylbilane synthase [Psychroflexus curvus]MBZ9626986.1 hydroxymethylbilane synthase [Psychroflexus curvus]MBZ9786980.1 hydroxymethylbilane synthase [Psychroflexus curvus]
MSKTIRIGTRDSELALWQAHKVKSLLEREGYTPILKPVKSTGDLNLEQPLYEMGITGIFTKTLDVALIKGEIDIAVHSMKDVPTALPKGVLEAAVLPRANTSDILIHKGLEDFSAAKTIATGSLRRKAQWLSKYPNHEVVNLRGNVNTRMKKLEDSDWAGAIFAAAGLERIDLKPENHIELDWMIPAPAQGAMLVVTMESNSVCKTALSPINHTETALAVKVEREFLKTLEGGCTAPIGALATIDGDVLSLKAGLFSLDGKESYLIEESTALDKVDGFGRRCAELVLSQGGDQLMQELRSIL